MHCEPTGTRIPAQPPAPTPSSRVRVPRVSSGVPAATRSRASVHKPCPKHEGRFNRPCSSPLQRGLLPGRLQPQSSGTWRDPSAWQGCRIYRPCHQTQPGNHLAAIAASGNHCTPEPPISIEVSGAWTSPPCLHGFMRTTAGRPSDSSIPTASLNNRAAKPCGLTRQLLAHHFSARNIAGQGQNSCWAIFCWIPDQRLASRDCDHSSAAALRQLRALAVPHVVIHAALPLQAPFQPAPEQSLRHRHHHKPVASRANCAASSISAGIFRHTPLAPGSGSTKSEPSTAPNFHCVTAPTSSLGMKRE